MNVFSAYGACLWGLKKKKKKIELSFCINHRIKLTTHMYLIKLGLSGSGFLAFLNEVLFDPDLVSDYKNLYW